MVGPNPSVQQLAHFALNISRNIHINILKGYDLQTFVLYVFPVILCFFDFKKKASTWMEVPDGDY